MIMRAALFALLLLAAPAAAQKPTSQATGQNADADPVIELDRDDPVMEAARAEARATLPEWLAVLENPPAGYWGIVFKFPLAGYEHIWVENVVRDGNVLHGTLANNPVEPGWALGDPVSVPLSDVSDWAYRDASGTAHGYRTVEALFSRLSPAEVAELRRDFGWDK